MYGGAAPDDIMEAQEKWALGGCSQAQMRARLKLPLVTCHRHSSFFSIRSFRT